MTDVAIIGAGIVGLATAYALSERTPSLDVCVLDKEPGPARHQTGRNSGVMHAGVYYQPGSAKARNCRRGLALLRAFCSRHEVPWEPCGKVVVASDREELPRLDELERRARANGVRFERVDGDRLRELEPHAAGVEALHVTDTGIVDYGAVAGALAAELVRRGVEFRYSEPVESLHRRGERWTVGTAPGGLEARWIVNCAGLYSDRIARLAGVEPGVRVVPFRGEYYLLRPEFSSLCRTLIYPVPDPAFPFLGVHFTRRISGRVDVGPNAVLAFAREGYLASDVHGAELLATLGWRGFQRLAWRHRRMGWAEWRRSRSLKRFAAAGAKLVPELRGEMLETAPAGVRAQAVTRDGQLVDDFAFVDSDGAVHVCNAPSPAATSCLSIGVTIAERLLRRMQLPLSPRPT